MKMMKELNIELKAELKAELKKLLKGEKEISFEEGLDKATALMYDLGIINDPQDYKYINIRRCSTDGVEVEVGFSRYFIDTNEVSEPEFWSELKRRNGGPIFNWSTVADCGGDTFTDNRWFRF